MTHESARELPQVGERQPGQRPVGQRQPGRRPVGDIDDFADPNGLVEAPTGLIGVGDDIWFTSIGNSRVGRVHPATGLVETFADPAGNVKLPANIHPGADGLVWFTCLGSNRLGTIDPRASDPASTITTFSHPELNAPVALKLATDGWLWFSLRGSNAIGTIDSRASDPLSTLRTFRSAVIGNPSALFVDDNGRIWWVNARDATIGSLDPNTAEPQASISSLGPWPMFGIPRAWAMDASGWLWLTTQDAPGLLTFDPGAHDPASTVRWVTHPGLEQPDGVWFGIDGSVWFVDTAGNTVGSYRPDGTRAIDKGADAWRFFGKPPTVDGPFDIKPSADASDGTLWFTNKTGNTLGRIVIV